MPTNVYCPYDVSQQELIGTWSDSHQVSESMLSAKFFDSSSWCSPSCASMPLDFQFINTTVAKTGITDQSSILTTILEVVSNWSMPV